jgi:hypothetical protein
MPLEIRERNNDWSEYYFEENVLPEMVSCHSIYHPELIYYALFFSSAQNK